MKGNRMIRLISLMIIVPMILAQIMGQIDLTQPTWLWLTAFAGLNALQASFTGWCPASGFLGKKGKCCDSDKSEKCCPPPEKKEASCCSGDDESCSGSNDTEKKNGSGSVAEANKSSNTAKTPDALIIKVLGTGCAKCETTVKLIEDLARKNKVSIQIIKVTNIADISGYGVMSTPAVVIDKAVVHAGSVPSSETVLGWLK